MQRLGGAELDAERREQPIPAERVRSEVQTVQFYDYLPETATPLKITDMFLHHYLHEQQSRDEIS